LKKAESNYARRLFVAQSHLELHAIEEAAVGLRQQTVRVVKVFPDFLDGSAQLHVDVELILGLLDLLGFLNSDPLHDGDMLLL
jgi:hypothetical protein